MSSADTESLSAAADGLRHMVDSGDVEMTVGQLLSMFDREDIPEDREEVADERSPSGSLPGRHSTGRSRGRSSRSRWPESPKVAQDRPRRVF